MSETISVAEAREIFNDAGFSGFVAMIDNLEREKERGIIKQRVIIDIEPDDPDPFSSLSAFKLRFIKWFHPNDYMLIRFLNARELKLGNDVQTPAETLAVFAQVLRENPDDPSTKKAFRIIDRSLSAVVGASNDHTEKQKKAEALLNQRDELLAQGKFEESDRIREKIAKLGYGVRDTETGSQLVWPSFKEQKNLDAFFKELETVDDLGEGIENFTLEDIRKM